MLDPKPVTKYPIQENPLPDLAKHVCVALTKLKGIENDPEFVKFAIEQGHRAAIEALISLGSLGKKAGEAFQAYQSKLGKSFAPYIWHNGKFVAWPDAQVPVMTHSLQYGSGCFEGQRAYNTERGPALFRLDDHVARLYYSAAVLNLSPKVTPEEMKTIIRDTVRINQLDSAYVRPFIYYGEKFGLNPEGAPTEVAVAAWKWASYLGGADAIRILESKIKRVHPETTDVRAKISGIYVNSILASIELKGTDYKEALLPAVNGDLAEGPGENLFLVKDGQILTPAVGGILPGITRDTVKTLARHLGYEVVEDALTMNDLLTADEAFYTGTAAEIKPIGVIGRREGAARDIIRDYPIGDGKKGPITARIQDFYGKVVKGEVPEFLHYLTFVD